MSRLLSFYFTLITLWCMLFSGTTAQQYSCLNATSMQNVSWQQFEGTWFEVARNPNVTNMGCIEIDLDVLPNNTTQINITYVNTQQSLWVNSTMNTNFTLNNTMGTYGYNVSFAMGGSSQPQTTYKVLDTDYNNYSFVCGYTNASDESTVFTAILTRMRMINSTVISNYEQMANQTFMGFTNMSMITQSQQCYKTSGAAVHLPMFATVAAILALLKYLY